MPEQFDSQYWTGQGPIFLAERDSTTGDPIGLEFIGDSPELRLDPSVQRDDVRENVSGDRNIASSIAGETTYAVALTMQSAKAEHLKVRIQGDLTAKAAGSVTDEAHKAYQDKFTALDNVKVSNIVITGSGGTPTYTANTDYVAYNDEGMVEFLSTGSIADAADVLIDYDYAAQKHVTANPQDKEWYLVMPGINRRRDGKRGRMKMYKLNLDPGGVNVIQDGNQADRVSLSGRLLYDDLRAAGDRLFKFELEN